MYAIASCAARTVEGITNWRRVSRMRNTAKTGKDHDSAFAFFPTFRPERSIFRYRNQNKVDYKAEKAASLSRKGTARGGSKKVTENQRNPPVSQDDAIDFSEFPPLPQKSSDQAPQAPTTPTAHAAPRKCSSKHDDLERARQEGWNLSTRPGSSVFTLIDTMRSLRTPFTSPVIRAILTLLDTITPFLRD